MRVWDADTGSCVATLQGHTKLVNCLEYVGGGGKGVNNLAPGADAATLRKACRRVLRRHGACKAACCERKVPRARSRSARACPLSHCAKVEQRGSTLVLSLVRRG